MTPKQFQNEIDFLFELRVLLDRYDVDIVAGDDGAEYGHQQPNVRLEFNEPYGVYEFVAISSADEVDDDVSFKVSE